MSCETKKLPLGSFCRWKVWAKFMGFSPPSIYVRDVPSAIVQSSISTPEQVVMWQSGETAAGVSMGHRVHTISWPVIRMRTPPSDRPGMGSRVVTLCCSVWNGSSYTKQRTALLAGSTLGRGHSRTRAFQLGDSQKQLVHCTLAHLWCLGGKGVAEGSYRELLNDRIDALDGARLVGEHALVAVQRAQLLSVGIELLVVESAKLLCDLDEVVGHLDVCTIGRIWGTGVCCSLSWSSTG